MLCAYNGQLVLTRRRPIARKISGIGVWDNVLEIMTVIAVVTNCALVGRTSSVIWTAVPPVTDAVKVSTVTGTTVIKVAVTQLPALRAFTIDAAHSILCFSEII
jgi:Calcium-activated chloride channel